MPRDLDALAGVVAMLVKSAVGPLQERLASAEAKLAQLTATDQSLVELRERVVVAETKASLMRPHSDFEAYLIRLAAVETELAAERDPEPLERRIVALEARPLAVPPTEELRALRDQLIAIERKADKHEERLGAFNTLGPAVMKAEEHIATLTKDLSGLRERLAVAEVKQGIPGPAGKDGRDGRDGADGVSLGELAILQGDDEREIKFCAMRDGVQVKDFGTVRIPAMAYAKTWAEGKVYQRGDAVTWGGGLWHCNSAGVSTKPGGPGQDWTLVVKPGRDGRDGKDAAGAPPVVAIGGGRG